MNILERITKNSPLKWKIIGGALVAASNGIVQYLISDHIGLRIVCGLMFIGYFLTHLTVQNTNDKPAQ